MGNDNAGNKNGGKNGATNKDRFIEIGGIESLSTNNTPTPKVKFDSSIPVPVSKKIFESLQDLGNKKK